MIIRRLELKDLESINEIWERCHKGKRGIPKRKFTITDAVAENGSGRLAGYGTVRFFAEALLFLDTDISGFQQAKAFKLLMDKAIEDCRRFDVEQLNVGVDDAGFEAILMNRYRFVPRNKMLILEIENGIT